MTKITIEKMKDEDIDEALLAEQSHNIHILSKNILKTDIKNQNYYYLVAKDEDKKIIGYIGLSYILENVCIEIFSITSYFGS